MRELTHKELVAIAMVTPCTCGQAEKGIIGGHVDECAAMVAGTIAFKRAQVEFALANPATFTPTIAD